MPAVAHGDAHFVRPRRQLDADPARSGEYFDGVVEQVPECPRQRLVVGIDGHRSVPPQGQRPAGAPAARPESRRRRALRARRNRAGRAHTAARPPPCVRSRARTPPASSADRWRAPARRSTGRAAPGQVRLLAQPLGELPQRRQRRAELVRHRRHEIRLQARDRHFPADGAQNQHARRNAIASRATRTRRQAGGGEPRDPRQSSTPAWKAIHQGRPDCED